MYSFAQQSSIPHLLNELQQNGLSDSARSELFTALAYEYQSKNIDSAFIYSTLAINIADSIKNQRALANAYNQQAGNYVWNSQPDTALVLYLKAIDICNTIKADETLFFAYTGVAYLYETTGAIDKSFDFSKKALLLSESLPNSDLKAFCYHEMAGISLELNNYSQAEDYFQRAKEGFIKLDNIDRLGSCCSDLSRLYITENKYAEAQVQLDSALQIFNNLDEPIQAAEVYEGYGLLYTQMKQLDAADVNFNKALNIYSANNMQDDEIRIEMDMGNMQLAKKQFAYAKTLLGKVYDYYKKNDNDEGQLAVIPPLALADSALGNNTVQHSYLAEYLRLSRALNIQRAGQRTRQLMLELNGERQIKENEKLRKENSDTKNWTLFAGIAGVIFLILAIFSFLSYGQKRKTNKDLKIAQQKADEAYTELKEMSGMKDKLFSILAHDLRSPLANTHHLLQLTKTGAIDSDIFAQLASELEVNLDYNRELLDNLLSWARSQMDGIYIDKKRIGLYKIVNDIFLLFAGIADKKQVKLINNIDADYAVMADENILQLALRNTISNAIKFSAPTGQVLVFARHENNKTVIAIKDSGVGISDEDKKNIFTLHTTSRRGTQSEKGAGIGLRITFEMMQKMGGNIRIESKAGSGTTVLIDLDSA